MKKKIVLLAVTLSLAVCCATGAFAASSTESPTVEPVATVTSPATGDPSVMLYGLSAAGLAVAAVAGRKSK